MKLTGKRILVTGGTGMIGRALIDKLRAKNPALITTVSMDDTPIEGVPHLKMNLCKDSLYDYYKDRKDSPEVLFHLAGIKGSPKLTASRPSTFFVNTILFNTMVLEDIRKLKPEWVLYTSSVGVYAPDKVFKEDTVWSTLPSPYDKFAGYAKRMGELQIEGYAIEHGLRNFSIIRPSNVYGPYDNFDQDTSMVVPATIAKAVKAAESEDLSISVWGDGTPVRDFVYSKQVADQMIFQVENEITEPLNAGSNKAHTIREMVLTVTKSLKKNLAIIWDPGKPSGDAYRTMDMTKALSYGFNPTYSLEDGIKETVAWYLEHRNFKRYDPFKDVR